jgi:hypothetical protein
VGQFAHWRGLLERNVGSARQALRALIPERLTFTPKGDGSIFEGLAVLDRPLRGHRST